MFKEIYVKKSSAVHKLDFWVKFICLLIILPLSAFITKPTLLMLLGILFTILLFASNIGLKKFWRLAKGYLVPITLGLLMLSLLFTSGDLQLRFSEGMILSLRFVLLISFGMLFSMVTNPIEFPAGFLRAKIPHRYGVTLMVGYRMMPLLSQKITTIVDAQKARGASFRPSLRRLDKFIFQLISLIVPLLHATLEMSVRLSDALISRGYNPEGKITVPIKKLGVYDFLIASVSIFILVLSFIR